MVITLTVANESNKDFTYHGQDRYFLSQGETIDSANKNMHMFLCKEYEYFESEIDICNLDLTDLLHTQFSKQRCDGECWTNLFPKFTLIRSNKAEVLEISQAMFDKIIEFV